MPERPNPNPDEVEFLIMLGNPSLSREQLYALSHVFRQHVEGTSRQYASEKRSDETEKEIKAFMKLSLEKPKKLGVSRRLIQKARNLGVEAAKSYSNIGD